MISLPPPIDPTRRAGRLYPIEAHLGTIRPVARLNYPTMPVRATVDPDLCIGSTECNRIAARAFRLDESLGICVVLPGAADTDEALLVKAAEDCPSQAIRLVRDDGTPQYGAA